MKTTHRIMIGIAILALVSVFIWKDSIPFLSSSALTSSEETVFIIQIPDNYTQEMYELEMNNILFAKYPECVSVNNITVKQRRERLRITFTCMKKGVTTDLLPTKMFTDTTVIPETTLMTEATVNIETTSSEFTTDVANTTQETAST